MRRPSLLVALVLVGATAVAGCSKDEGSPSATLSSGEPSIEPGQSLEATWPLTGLPATGSEDPAQRHPVLVTKMDNTTSASPQAGLGSADLVVEELVEGGLTRLAVFHYSQLPKVAGPVRSMRASDIGIVSPADAVVVTSGAAARTKTRISDAGIRFFEEGAAGISRAADRSAPYNVMADLQTLADEASGSAVRPPDYLPWGSEDDLPAGRRARTVNATFSGGHTTSWVYQGGGYVNTNTNAAADDQFPADTILVLRVAVGDAGYLDPAGNPVPETRLEGSGPALLFHAGRVVRATWAKDGLDASLTLSTKAGELTVPAGHTWIELVPSLTGDPRFSGGAVTFK